MDLQKDASISRMLAPGQLDKRADPQKSLHSNTVHFLDEFLKHCNSPNGASVSNLQVHQPQQRLSGIMTFQTSKRM